MARPISILLAFALLCWGSNRAALAAASDASLYEVFGGEPGLTGLVEDTITRALTDPRIQHSFDESNVKRVKRELVSQFCELLGGPCVYKGRDMHEAHQKLMITDAQFNALVEDLQDAMEKLDIPFGAQNQLLAKLAPMHDAVVTK